MRTGKDRHHKVMTVAIRAVNEPSWSFHSWNLSSTFTNTISYLLNQETVNRQAALRIFVNRIGCRLSSLRRCPNITYLRRFHDSSSIDADSVHCVQDVEVGSDLPSVRGPAEPRRIVIPPWPAAAAVCCPASAGQLVSWSVSMFLISSWSGGGAGGHWPLPSSLVFSNFTKFDINVHWYSQYSEIFTH